MRKGMQVGQTKHKPYKNSAPDCEVSLLQESEEAATTLARLSDYHTSDEILRAYKGREEHLRSEGDLCRFSYTVGGPSIVAATISVPFSLYNVFDAVRQKDASIVEPTLLTTEIISSFLLTYAAKGLKQTKSRVDCAVEKSKTELRP